MTDPPLAELAGIFADVTGSEPPSPDTDLIESICEENSKDLPHMVGK